MSGSRIYFYDSGNYPNATAANSDGALYRTNNEIDAVDLDNLAVSLTPLYDLIECLNELGRCAGYGRDIIAGIIDPETKRFLELDQLVRRVEAERGAERKADK